MKKILVAMLTIGVLTSCAKKLFFISDKNDYLIVNGDKHIMCNFDRKEVVGSNSEYKLSIVNTHIQNMNVFSTVIDNKSMFYSKKNYKLTEDKIFFDSYYKNFMEQADHSGIKKFNFIIIPPNDTLTININPRYLINIKKLELRYYYFITDDIKNLLNVENIKFTDTTQSILLNSKIKSD